MSRRTLKGIVQDAEPRRITTWLKQERSYILPYGAPDQRSLFAPERVAVEKLDGTLIAERLAPRDAFAGAPDAHSLWTYLTTPFLLAASPLRN